MVTCIFACTTPVNGSVACDTGLDTGERQTIRKISTSHGARAACSWAVRPPGRSTFMRETKCGSHRRGDQAQRESASATTNSETQNASPQVAPMRKIAVTASSAEPAKVTLMLALMLALRLALRLALMPSCRPLWLRLWLLSPLSFRL